LLQRVRELGGDADGYLRKEAAASTVVERLREVLRPRARVEQRVASGGEVRGRLDGLTPRLVLELSCRAQRDVRVSIRDASFLYEVQVRQGAPRTAIRSANDGSFERGEGVLAMLLGVSAGRFVIEPDDSPCRAELSGSLHEQLAGPVARARAAQRALSAGALASVTRVAFDAARVGGYLECTPEPAQSLLRELITGASPRDLLTTGRAPARLLEAVLSDFARRGGVLLVETAGGIEDISQTRIPPAATPNMTALSVPLPEAEPVAAAPAAPATAPAVVPAPVVLEPAPELEEPAPPVSQRKPPAIYSQPPDSELESADAGWFTFQIESSAQPPKIEEADEITAVTGNPAPAAGAPAAPAVQPERPPVPRAEDPLRKTLTSSAPPATEEEEAAPGTSVPVHRGYRPPLRTDTLGSAGNEAAVAQAAVAAGAVLVPVPTPAPVEKSPPRPAVKIPRPVSPAAPPVVEEDALTAALSDETPSPEPAAPVPVVAAPVRVPEPEPAPEPEPSPEPQPAPAPTPATFGQTLPLSAMKAPPVLAEGAPAPAPVKAPSSQREPKRSEVSTQPPKAAPRQVSSKAPSRPAPAPAAAKPEADGGWLRTAVFAVLAAGASYYGVTKLFGAPPPPVPAAPAVVAPAPVPVTPSAAAPAPKLQITTSDSPLPPGTDLPAGNGLLEIQVPDGTAIRVDNEYLGMGPGRRVPLTPGPHNLSLGDAPPQTVTIKAGQRTLAAAAGAATPAPAGSP
jgi:hypothetical protein